MTEQQHTAPTRTPALDRAYAAADAAADMVTPPTGVTTEAWTAEHRSLAYRRGMIHAALSAALDVDEMAKAFLPTLDNWWCGDHIDYHPELDDDDQPECAECRFSRVAQANEQATVGRAHILGDTQ